MKLLYIDSDIFLDIFLQRDEHYEPASELLSLVDLKKVKAVTTPLVFSNLFYILQKYRSKSVALKALKTLEQIVGVIPVDDRSVRYALDSKFTDFEDALQYFSALKSKVTVIVTRNTKDYKTSDIPVFTAKEFLSLYQKRG